MTSDRHSFVDDATPISREIASIFMPSGLSFAATAEAR
jgi:hypothetical protein